MVEGVREAASESHVTCKYLRFVLLGISVAENNILFRKSIFITCLGHIWELFMNISNVYGKSEGGYLPLCASLYWQPIYIPLNIGHLSAVTTAIPWLLKQDCKKFYVWGELYMSLSKSDGRGDVYIWRMREGQSRCTPGILWRYEGISILGLNG